MAFGIDYSFGSGLSANTMKAAGVRFVCRYLSWQPNPKNINKAEFDNLIKSGLFVVFVWEGTGRDLVNGFRGGAHDSQEASRQVAALGAPGCPIYFAPADYDVPEGDQGMINSYLDGVASVIGRGRTGYYGGYWPLKRAADAGKAHWWWQTYAWSGGNLDQRAHLFQYQNAARMGPAEVDFDRSLKPDCGWWPRPKPAAAKPAAPKPAAAPVHAPGMAGGSAPLGQVHVWHADGTGSLVQFAAWRNATVLNLLRVSAENLQQADFTALNSYVTAGVKTNMPKGLAVCTLHA